MALKPFARFFAVEWGFKRKSEFLLVKKHVLMNGCPNLLVRKKRMNKQIK